MAYRLSRGGHCHEDADLRRCVSVGAYHVQQACDDVGRRSVSGPLKRDMIRRLTHYVARFIHHRVMLGLADNTTRTIRTIGCEI